MDGFIKILIENCLGCGICSDVCTTMALIQEKEIPIPEYYAHLCTNCLECYEQCPFGAIALKGPLNFSSFSQSI